MNIDYFFRKQEILLRNTSTDFVRQTYLKAMENSDRLIALIGARGVGKTTVLLQYLKKLDIKMLYLSADDIEFANVKMYDLVDEFYALGGRVVVIDEIHRYKNWAQEVKNIYDSFPDLTMRISGSSMLNILYEKFDLSRRLVVKEMKSMQFVEYLESKYGKTLSRYSFEEILSTSNVLSKDLISKYPSLYGDFKAYLKFGAYPFYMEGIDSYSEKLFNALEKIVYEDIPSLHKIDYSHLSFFNKLIFKVVASKKPFSVSIAALSREFGITEPTLYTYLDIVERASIFKFMRKMSKKVSKKPQKILFSNTSILYAYAEKFDIEVDIGTVRETFFTTAVDTVYYSDIGDFVVNGYIFEVGGKNKSFDQIKEIDNGYLVVDVDFSTNERKIPLWLFGFLLAE